MPEQAHIETKLLSSLAGAGSMLAELRLIMDRGPAAAAKSTILSWILDENLLAKRTASGRSNAASKLVRRYVLDPSDLRFSTLCAAWRAASAEPAQQALLAFLLYGTQDGLVRRAACEWLAPLLREPGRELLKVDTVEYIELLAQTEPSVGAWRESTRRSIAEHLMTAVRDFGFATGEVKKRVASPSVGPVVSWFAAKLGVMQRLSGEALMSSEWFRMLGLDGPKTADALARMASHGLGRFRASGTVAEVELFDLPSAGGPL